MKEVRGQPLRAVRARAAKYTREQLRGFAKNAGRANEVGWQVAAEAEATASEPPS